MPMISDEERREVAARLRYEESADPGCLNTFGDWYLISFLQSINKAVDNGTEYRLRERLADLIDRPTCTVENVIYRDSWEEYEVQLSCGHEIITTESADGLAFCQYCGAEVIPHAERRD